MEPGSCVSYRVAHCPIRGTNCHGLALLLMLFFVATLRAQPAAASITNTPQPFCCGPAIFDAAGNLYYFGGYSGTGPGAPPITAGAAQTQSSGGLCSLNAGPGNSSLFPCSDAWVGKFDTSGNVVFGTLLGGPANDYAAALTVDGAGNVFLAGVAGGSFPTTPHAAITSSATAKLFAAKLSADGSHFVYSTYLPDTAGWVSAIAVDGQGNAYLAGQSFFGHAYVAKLNATGSAFVYYVSLGGSGQDTADAIVADAAGNVIVAGHTSSPNFPVSRGVVQSHLAGVQNIFVAKLGPSGAVVFSTYLGGSGTETPAVVKTDAAGNIYVAGQTSSLDFPTTPDSFEPAAVVPLWNNSGPGGFVVEISQDGSALVWSSYVMSTDDHAPFGVTQLAVTASGETYITGVTGAGFPVTVSAPQVCFGASPQYLSVNVFLAHLDHHGALLDATYVGQDGVAAVGLSLADDGSVLLPWDANGQHPVSRIRFGGAGWTAPACLSPTVLNGATQSGAQSNGPSLVVVPGEVITLTGFGIGPDVGVVYQPDAQGGAPRQLAGVQVLFDGQPAPVLYAQSRQINAVAPVELSGQPQTTITVVYNQITFGSIQASVSRAGMPGIFRLQPNISTQASAINQDGTVNGPSNPAPPGSVVSLWGTGFGPTDPPCTDGSLNAPGPVNLATGWSVSIREDNGSYIPALYAGGAPALLCGVVQINMVVPADAGPGVHQLIPRSTDAYSNVQPTIYVK